jgi:copper chaperone CopZ
VRPDRAAAETVMETTFAISGMHCGACADKVGAALRRVPGVARADVTLSPPRAVVESEGAIDPGALSRAAHEAGGYALTETSEGSTPDPGSKPSLYPLVLIVLYLAGAVALGDWARGRLNVHALLNDFMAGFFLVFSFFKLLDLRGFAGAYRGYDLLAKASKPWAYVYPFVELALAAGYLVEWRPPVVNAVTLVVMLIGAAGVLRALLKKDAIRCACLGTALNLPMTTVTLVEDLGMAAMAAVMLAWRP